MQKKKKVRRKKILKKQWWSSSVAVKGTRHNKCFFFFSHLLGFYLFASGCNKDTVRCMKSKLNWQAVVSFETIASDMFEDILCTLFHFSYRWLTIEIDEYHCINITNCKSIFVHSNFAYRLHEYLWWINFYGIVHSHKVTCICQPWSTNLTNIYTLYTFML